MEMTGRLAALRNEFIGRMPAVMERHFSIFIGGEWLSISEEQHDAAFARSLRDRSSVEAAFIANQQIGAA
jgi:hypothetical protein